MPPKKIIEEKPKEVLQKIEEKPKEEEKPKTEEPKKEEKEVKKPHKFTFAYLCSDGKYRGLYKGLCPSIAAKKIFSKWEHDEERDDHRAREFDKPVKVFLKCYDNEKKYAFLCQFKKLDKPIKMKIGFKTFTRDYEIRCRKIHPDEYFDKDLR
jgi:hypothetical protein